MNCDEREPDFGSLEWLESLSIGERLPVAQVWAQYADKAVDSDPGWSFKATMVHLKWAVAELAKYVGHEPTLSEEALYEHGQKVRAEVLREAADKLALVLTADGPSLPGYPLATKSAVRELRRMADEAATR